MCPLGIDRNFNDGPAQPSMKLGHALRLYMDAIIQSYHYSNTTNTIS